jgi:hypothetical protein
MGLDVLYTRGPQWMVRVEQRGENWTGLLSKSRRKTSSTH